MNFRLFLVLVLLSLLASVSGVGSVLAEAPIPPLPTPLPPSPEVSPAWNPEAGPQHAPPALPLGEELSAQGLNLGQPGLSFRYVNTFGQTGVAYIDDSTHLNYPWGLGVDGTNIWIGELSGNRAMKYGSTGLFQQQIGIAGLGYLPDTTLWEVADVGVDGGGNVWVVDDAAAHIARFNSSGAFQSELGSPWTSGTDNSHFGSPVSIAFDAAGNIYVSDGAPWYSVDVGNHRIQVFNSSGSYITTIGVTGAPGSINSRFHGPSHITIYGSLLYVADAGNQRVQIFDISTAASPAFVATLGVTGVSGTDNSHFNRPSGVAVDVNYIYVADTFNNRVQVFNRTTRAYVGSIGNDSVDGKRQFQNPYDVAVDTGGNLYVADFGNVPVQQFLPGAGFPDGYTYGTKGAPYSADGSHYNNPSGVAVADDGRLFLTEDTGHRLIASTSGGSASWTIGTPGIKANWDLSNDRLDNPADVAVDASGRVYVADRWHNRVQVYNSSDGSYIATIGGLSCPGGVHIAPNGYLYVANTCNHTVKVYNASFGLVATLGASGVPGANNAHFNSPEDVAVDGNGTIYVTDQKNDRVQVFNASRAYVRTIGVSGVCRKDFAHLCLPDGLFVNSLNRLYIADTGNSRVQVFDSSGAYLTTIGGSWGAASGQMRSPTGLAGDAAGNLYVADHDNHRIQKFAPGVPGWSQVNINGFGYRGNGEVSAMAPFGGQLYAGTTNSNGAQLWRSSDGITWSAVMTNGFGNPKNVGIEHLLEFNGSLYAGVWNSANTGCSTSNGGEIWRSADGSTWSRVAQKGFDNDPLNAEIYRFAVFNNTLYAATWSWSPTHAGEIWSSTDGSAWTIAVPNGFGDINNWATTSLEAYNGYLYAGTYNPITGSEVWRCSTCSGPSTNWTEVNTAGFADAGNLATSSLATFGSYLYASTRHAAGAGAEVWRCTTCDVPASWTQVADNGLGKAATNGDGGLDVFNGQLHFVVDNRTTGAEVWRCTSCDGTDWGQGGYAGFGDGNNGLDADKTAIFDSRLYIGTSNSGNGAEIWAPPALPYPAVASISLANASPTNAASVSFIVTFSENVTGVDPGDFSLTASAGLTGASITGLSGSGNTYIATAATGTGNGTLRLDLTDDDSIVDEATGAKHLGGAGAGNGDFTTGQYYAIPTSMSIRSLASSDGWVLESGENSNTGGSLNVKATTFNLGDDASNKQYRAILSFNTAALPDHAVITSVTLKFRKQGQVGVNPFSTLSNIVVDVKSGPFGGNKALQIGDFQAAASKNAVLAINNTPTNGWYSKALASANLRYINKRSVTQFRLRFAKDDDNDRVADYLTFYSGDVGTVANRPLLIVKYYVP